MLNKKSKIVSTCNHNKKPSKQYKKWKECLHCLTPTSPRFKQFIFGNLSQPGDDSFGMKQAVVATYFKVKTISTAQ